jgi:hypothetical protein
MTCMLHFSDNDLCMLLVITKMNDTRWKWDNMSLICLLGWLFSLEYSKNILTIFCLKVGKTQI